MSGSSAYVVDSSKYQLNANGFGFIIVETYIFSHPNFSLSLLFLMMKAVECGEVVKYRAGLLLLHNNVCAAV